MNVTRIYTGEDGESHFEDVNIPLFDRGAIGKFSTVEHASGVIFRETDGSYNYTWHPAPQRQYVITIEGEVEIEVGDGTIRQFGAGEVLLAEDTTGRGHISRAVNQQPRKSIFVTLDRCETTGWG